LPLSCEGHNSHLLNSMAAVNIPLRFDWRSRFKPALIHLAASLVVAVVVAAMVFALWYPGVYRSLSGGTELFLLVVGVDWALGPLITLVIFDIRKPVKELRRDVAVVIALQLGALGYGLHMVSISRPVVLALEQDRFRVVPASGIYEKELPAALPEFRGLSLTGPRLVRSVLPTDPVKKSDALMLGLSGYDIGARPALWQPWDDKARAEAASHAKPLVALAQRYPDRRAELEAAVAATGRAAQGLLYIPMITFRGDWVALLDAANGDVAGFAPFDGF
jgi:hypothetical protein